MKNKQIKKLNRENKEHGISKNTMILRYTHFYNVRPRSSDPFDIVTYWVYKISYDIWTDGMIKLPKIKKHTCDTHLINNGRADFWNIFLSYY